MPVIIFLEFSAMAGHTFGVAFQPRLHLSSLAQEDVQCNFYLKIKKYARWSLISNDGEKIQYQKFTLTCHVLSKHAYPDHSWHWSYFPIWNDKPCWNRPSRSWHSCCVARPTSWCWFFTPISYRCNRIANFLDNGKLYGPWSQVSPKGKLILLLSPPTQNQINFYSNNTPALTPGILVNTDAYRFP